MRDYTLHSKPHLRYAEFAATLGPRQRKDIIFTPPEVAAAEARALKAETDLILSGGHVPAKRWGPADQQADTADAQATRVVEACRGFVQRAMKAGQAAQERRIFDLEQQMMEHAGHLNDAMKRLSILEGNAGA